MTFCIIKTKDKNGQDVDCPVNSCMNSNEYCCFHNPNPIIPLSDVSEPPCDHKCGYYRCEYNDCENVGVYSIEEDPEINHRTARIDFMICGKHYYPFQLGLNRLLGEEDRIGIPINHHEELGIEK